MTVPAVVWKLLRLSPGIYGELFTFVIIAEVFAGNQLFPAFYVFQKI